ncbi:MAG: amino acid ABC transporter permease [Lactobacillales bacterium]|jgi:putative glutamine transport system permease protein|nr:amino acid ABC transporter permease [Lactobacillales bacterium]
MIGLFQQYAPDFLLGFKNTLIASGIALFFSLIIGTLMALFQLSENCVVKTTARIYVEVFRNIPLIVIVMFFFIALPMRGIKITGMQAGIIGLIIYTSSFIAETVRAGIQAVPKGQMEAGLSQGLSYWKSMYYIVLPQAFKIVIPPLGNQFINLVKNSSILAVVAGIDLMYEGDLVATTTFQTIPSYLLVGLFYLIITLPISYLMVYLERRWNVFNG